MRAVEASEFPPSLSVSSQPDRHTIALYHQNISLLVWIQYEFTAFPTWRDGAFNIKQDYIQKVVNECS